MRARSAFVDQGSGITMPYDYKTVEQRIKSLCNIKKLYGVLDISGKYYFAFCKLKLLLQISGHCAECLTISLFKDKQSYARNSI